MKTRAAVLYGRNEPFKVQEVDLDPPGPHEVRVRVAAAGLCHSDYHLVTGDLPMAYPVIAGHEGAGVIEEIGTEVTSVEPGDHAVLSFIPACGHCRSCATGRSNLCDLGASILAGPQIDGTYRFHVGGVDAGQMCLLGTFAEHTVVPDVSVVRIDRSIPLRTAALIGCGVPTGYGAAVNKAKVRPGDSVVVWGAGGIGMNAIQGATLSGARIVVAVEPDEAKRKLAYEVFGATHVVDPNILDPVDAVYDATWNRGADVSIATPGVLTEPILRQALQVLAKGGRAVLVAVPPAGDDHLPIAPLDVVLFERQILGTVYGSSNPFSDIPQRLLVAAGFDTTASGIGRMLQLFATNPQIRQAFKERIEDSQAVDVAFEELIRYISPVPGLARTVTEPCEFAGQDLEQGDRLLLLWPAANRDPDEFDNPNEFVADRKPNRHVGFGSGIHRCLGAHVARKEIRVLLEEYFRRGVPEYRLNPDKPPVWHTGDTWGVKSLPVIFEL